MDNQQVHTGRVKPLFFYLKDSIKFYELKNPAVAQIIFLIDLAVIFIGNMLAGPYNTEFFKNFEQVSSQLQAQFESKNFDFTIFNSDIYVKMLEALGTILVIQLVITALTFLFSLFYGTYYYFSLTKASVSVSEALSVFTRRLPKIILFNLLFYFILLVVFTVLMLTAGMMAVFIQAFALLTTVIPITILVVASLYVFKDLLFIEFNVGIFRNFKKAMDLTRGSRKNVIFNALWPVLTGWLFSFLAVDFENEMLSLLITAFIQVIVLLIAQRLNALMFIDAASMERLDRKPEPTEENKWNA